MEAQEESAGPSRFWLAAIPVALALIFHAPVLFNGFVWDDRSLIVNNPRWSGAFGEIEFFSRDYGLDLGGQARGYYRPLFTLLTWWLHSIAGASPIVYHAFGLMVFCAGVLLVWYLFHRIFPTKWLPVIAASICAVHPLNTEVVAIFASLPDWICQMAMCLAVLAALESSREASDGRATKFLSLGILSISSLFVKETSFLLLGALAATLIGDAIFSSSGRKLARTHLILDLAGGLCAAYFVRRHVLGDFPNAPSLFAPLTQEGAPRALWACMTGARLFFLPTETIFIRDVTAEPNAFASILIAALLIAGAALWIWFLRKGRLVPAIMLGWLGAGLYNLSLATAAGLPYSERYLSVVPAIYFASLGLAQIRMPAPRANLLVVALMAYCGIQTALGTLKCSDSVRFFASLHDERPDEIYGMTGLADALYWDKGDFENATRLANEAIVRRPDDQTVRTMGQLLARIALLEKRPADALRHLDWAEKTQPDYSIIENLRADALAQLGRIKEALDANQRAIDLDSENSAFRVQRAYLLVQSDEANDEEVWRELQRVKAMGGNIPESLDSLGKIRATRQAFSSQKP